VQGLRCVIRVIHGVCVGLCRIHRMDRALYGVPKYAGTIGFYTSVTVSPMSGKLHLLNGTRNLCLKYE
jgi:hypothetical protein